MTSPKIYPRVLIIAHNALSDTQNNGKTVSAFFRGWDIENIAQIYLTTDTPDFTVCKKFFQIHDFDILKRAFLKDIQGREITEYDVLNMKAYKQSVRSNPLLKVIRNNVSPIVRFSRDLLWSIAGLKTKALKQFIDEFNPQIVFFQASNAKFAFTLVKWICLERNIPLIIQTTDDYVTSKFSLDPFFWIQHQRILKASKWAYTYANYVVAIGEKMAKEFKSRFGGNYLVAMNSVNELNLLPYKADNKIIKLTFAGNLALNRWKILAIIVEGLKELGEEEGLLAELSIYSLEPADADLEKLNVPPYSFYKGKIDTEGLNLVKEQSDILIHVEAFDKKNKHITRLSISTKIPEYLASGRAILAIGPADVASMEYLAEFDLAFTVNTDDKDTIKRNLRKIILDPDQRIRYAVRGKAHADSYHNQQQKTEEIFEKISEAITNKN